jgi:hypothetical protein
MTMTCGNFMHMTGSDPFAALGLPARADLSDDEVRAAWRRIAAATHPDLPDGGDSERFAAAAAAYACLRTPYDRGEAYADLHTFVSSAIVPPPAPAGDDYAADRGTTGTAVAPAPPPADPWPADPWAAGPRLTVLRSADPRRAGLRAARRVRTGRPGILALRVLLTIAVSWACVAVAGWQPATLAITIGALTWLARTTHHDLAPTP